MGCSMLPWPSRRLTEFWKSLAGPSSRLSWLDRSYRGDVSGVAPGRASRQLGRTNDRALDLWANCRYRALRQHLSDRPRCCEAVHRVGSDSREAMGLSDRTRCIRVIHLVSDV